MVDLDVGRHDDIPWFGTDLAFLGYGDLLAAARLDDTPNAYEDGAYLGSALFRVAPEACYRLGSRGRLGAGGDRLAGSRCRR